MADNFISKSSIELPSEVSSEIIQKTQEQSAVMRLAREIKLPGTGVSVPAISSDPEAEWVTEGGKKPVKTATLDKKLITPYKLAVIVPFSMEFVRDAANLYDALIARLPLALAEKFDSTVFGGTTKPGENFDTFASCTAQDIETNAYAALVAADADIADHDGITNGYVISPKAKAILLSAVDGNKRPLFINNVAEGAIPMILGAPTYQSRGAYVAGTPDAVGVAGDWTKAVYGTVSGTSVTVSDQASLTLSDGTVLNLWQQNMVAVRAEIELGFRADLTVFDRLVKKATRKQV